MKLRRQIKLKARHALAGNWGKAIAILLVCVSLLLIFHLFQGLVSLLTNIPEFADIFSTPRSYLDDAMNISLASLVLTGIFVLINLFVNSPLLFGVRRWYYRLVSGEPDDAFSMFSFFGEGRLFGKAIWHDLNLFVRTLLWSIPFAIVPSAVCGAAYAILHAPVNDLSRLGGILLMILGGLLGVTAEILFFVFQGRYFLSAYLIVDAPSEVSVRQAFKRSIRMMKGKKKEIFLFRLSFLPWALLCLLALPLLYVAPYWSASQALYAKYLIELYHRDQESDAAPEETEGDSTADGDSHLDEPAATAEPEEGE